MIRKNLTDLCGVVVDTTNLQGAIFTWWRDYDGKWQAKKTITIDPHPAQSLISTDAVNRVG